MQNILHLCLLLGAIALDLFPAWLAFQRRHPKRHLILFLDIVLGWTVIAWIMLLAWTLTSDQSREAKSAS